MAWHLAQLNVGRLHAPIDDPQIAEFKDALDEINALADSSPGFVWRLQTEDGNNTASHPIDDDELVIVNISVWDSIEALADYVYRSDHTGFLRRRREWFQRYGKPYLVLWWVPAGHIPSVTEALERLHLIERDGPTPEAFTFTKRFAPPLSGGMPEGGRSAIPPSVLVGSGSAGPTSGELGAAEGRSSSLDRTEGASAASERVRSKH